MSSNRKGSGFWIRAWLPVAAGVAVIAVESTEWLGADYTSGPLRFVYQALFGHVDDARWELIHHLIRKTGHFVGYGLIGLAWLRAWWMSLPNYKFLQDAALALLCTALLASADECHQLFLSNRTGSAMDVLVDCCGAITLQLIAYFALRIVRPKRLARVI